MIVVVDALVDESESMSGLRGVTVEVLGGSIRLDKTGGQKAGVAIGGVTGEGGSVWHFRATSRCNSRQ
jgi:hypothetical protein